MYSQAFLEEKVRKREKLFILVIALLPVLFFGGCDIIVSMTAHEIIAEDSAYLRGTTSGAGYINLMENRDWVAYKSSIKEITSIKIEYRVTRNGTTSDISVDFYFGENKADVYLGNAFLAQGETHTELQNLPMEKSYYQLIDLILRNDAFWYSIQGNISSAEVDFEPVRITISGTFDVK
jgi:hypothetical protein